MELQFQFHKQLSDCLRKMRFERGKKGKNCSKPIFNEKQFQNLQHAFVAKLSKFCSSSDSPSQSSSSSCMIPHNIKRRVCVVAQCVEDSTAEEESIRRIFLQRAWRELLRATKEAEIFLQSCCGQDWWKKVLTMAVTGEAHSVHMHDLLWAVFCLDVCIQEADPDQEETYDGLCCRRLGEFYAQMNSSLRVHAENADRKQLIKTLREIWKEHDKKNALKKLILSNTDEDNRARLAKFLAERLQKMPNFFSIDPRDLKQKGADELRSGLHPDNYISEAYWLGIKVGIAKTNIEFYRNHVSVFSELESPFVIQVIGVCMDGDDSYIVTEISSSNLHKWVQEKRLSMHFHVMVDIMLQICRGMEYLHGKRILHLDLTPHSILFEPSVLKDFREEGHGRVKIFPNNLLMKPTPSSYNCWMAPEIFHSDRSVSNLATAKSDVYSFAMICYYILTGNIPFDSKSMSTLHSSITNGQRPSLSSSVCPTALADYLARCWHPDPAHRPAFSDVSVFLRYLKLLSMRITNPQGLISYVPFCKEFDSKQMKKYQETAKAETDKLTMEEEGLIIRALEGEFPESFGTPEADRSSTGTATAMSSRRVFFMLKSRANDTKFLVNLPNYIKRYSYEQLHRATLGFSATTRDQKTGFWKTMLPDHTYATIKAVDKIYTPSLLSELTLLSRLHHPNIITLSGICTGASKYYLIYTYMALDSLDKRLFGTSQGQLLTWSLRKRIAIGIARGLAHIHRDYSSIILGMKIDTKSIFLDERFTPKLCGFGSISILDCCSDSQRRRSSPGGNGYSWLKKSQKQDQEAATVYSFGVILIELLSGRRGTDITFDEYYHLHESLQKKSGSTQNALKVIDSGLRGDVTDAEALQMVNLALWCLLKDPSQRPSLSNILLVLEGLQGRLAVPTLGHMEVLPPSLGAHFAVQYQRNSDSTDE